MESEPISPSFPDRMNSGWKWYCEWHHLGINVYAPGLVIIGQILHGDAALYDYPVSPDDNPSDSDAQNTKAALRHLYAYFARLN